jgi:Abnormal spindle-like microcephaly-assoc'd, ASPM-SPD-2-Hydin
MSPRCILMFVFGATAALMGCGGAKLTAPQSSPSGPIPAGQLVLSPSTLTFGTVAVGSSKNLKCTLTAGSSNITISSAEWNGTGFAVGGITFPSTVPAGRSIPFSVSFTPQTAGNASGRISFLSNAVNSPSTETLAGVGAESPTQHSVTLSWNPSTSAVVGYNLYRRTDSTTYAKLNSSPLSQTDYTDTTVQSGMIYYYAATSVAPNLVESSHSNETKAVIP